MIPRHESPIAAGSPALLAASLGLLATACAAVGPARPQFGDPETAARSYVAAFLRDDAADEYRCLAESFKKREGATLERYVLFRARLEDSIGAARTLANLGLARPRFAVVSRTGPRAFVRVEAAGRTLTFSLEAEGWWSVAERGSGRRLEGTVGDLALAIRPTAGGLEARIEDPEVAGMDPAAIGELALKEDWKIAEIAVEGSAPAP